MFKINISLVDKYGNADKMVSKYLNWTIFKVCNSMWNGLYASVWPFKRNKYFEHLPVVVLWVMAMNMG